MLQVFTSTTMWLLFCTLMAVMSLRCTAQEETWDESLSIHQGMRSKAAMGDRDAQWLLGNDYFYGKHDVKQNEAAGVQLISQAAEQGHMEATQLMGHLLVQGHPVVTKDPKRGIKFLEKSANEGGNAKSMYLLGKAYYSGKGLDHLTESQRMAKAFKWYKAGADRGCMHSRTDLGDMYRLGKGTKQDYDKALYCYRKVSLEFDSIALNTQQKPEVVMNKTTVAKALNTLGGMYGQGIGVKLDYDMAYKYLSKAAGIGHENAKKNMAVIEKQLEKQKEKRKEARKANAEQDTEEL